MNYLERVMSLIGKTEETPAWVEEIQSTEAHASDEGPVLSHLDTILRERGSRYGEFSDNADIAQDLKVVLHQASGWENLQNDQKEALEVIASKISRILTGDPDYADSWDDISGYAQLVSKRIKGHAI